MSKASHLQAACGSQLEYFERGEGTPVVLLHCTGSSAAQWKPLADLLAADHRVVAANLYGYGGTSAWDGRAVFRLRHEAVLVEELVRHLGEPVHLVGHSYGASVALAFARRMPELVRTLSVFEPASFHLLRQGDVQDQRALGEIAQVANTVWHALASGEYVMAAQFFVDYWSGCGAWLSLPMARQQAIVARVPKIGLDFQATVNEPAERHAFGHLSMPRLVMQGERSTLPAQRICKLLAQLWPDARLAGFEGAGHMAPVTHADQVNREIVQFLRSPVAHA